MTVGSGLFAWVNSLQLDNVPTPNALLQLQLQLLGRSTLPVTLTRVALREDFRLS